MADRYRPEVFIFDLDGTLVDSRLDVAGSANVVRVHFGLPALPVPVLVRYVGDGVRVLLQRALGHDVATGLTGGEGLPVDDDLLDAGQAVFAAHYAGHLLDNTRLYQCVPAVLDHLAPRPLLVATNKPQGFAETILDGLGLAGRFGRIIGGDTAPRRKPDPSHLTACLSGLAVAAAKVVVVGDSPNDVNAARALGAVSVGCTYGLVAPERIRAAGPDHVIDAFSELRDLFD